DPRAGDEPVLRVARAARVGRAAAGGSLGARRGEHAAAALDRLLRAGADRVAGALLALVVERQAGAARGEGAHLVLARRAARAARAAAARDARGVRVGDLAAAAEARDVDHDARHVLAGAEHLDRAGAARGARARGALRRVAALPLL